MAARNVASSQRSAGRAGLAAGEIVHAGPPPVPPTTHPYKGAPYGRTPVFRLAGSGLQMPHSPPHAELIAVARPRSPGRIPSPQQVPDALDPCVLLDQLDQVVVQL